MPNSMYALNRILSGDPFYVKITPWPEGTPMEPIAEFRVTARPERHLVEIYDADAYLGDEAALAASRQRVVAGNGYHLYLHSLQPDIRVHIAVRIWPTPPKPPVTAEGHVPVTLESETGTLVINQLTLGPAGEATLPRPGVYEGHAWWRGRTATSAYYDRILQQIGDDWDTEQIGQAWSQCPEREEYTLDLAFTTAPSPEEDEDRLRTFVSATRGTSSAFSEANEERAGHCRQSQQYREDFF